MFTGIVTDVGEIIAVHPRSQGLLHRVKIACAYDRAGIVEGASIACAGICLTVVGIGEEDGRTWFAVDVAAETLRLTTLGRWRHGTRVNLERALKLADELGGHIVAGHGDGIATVIEREDLPDMARLAFRVPHDLARFIAAKGSVALDGVSLTVNEVVGDTFAVLIIPHTLHVTTIGACAAGDDVNIEVDLIARHVARLLEARS